VNSTSLRRIAVPAVTALAMGLTLAACGDKASGSGAGGGTLSGGGATSQANAEQAWRANYQKANGGTINYEEVGSGTGITNFTSKAYSFAGTDAYLTDEQLSAATDACGAAPIEVPAYISPIAVAFNLPGVESLKLDARTVADIFAGKITTWNDAAIASQNSGVDLPGTTIATVHRSDESGTTQNFTDYLNKASGGAWTEAASGTWPIQGGEAAQGTSGVIGAVQGGNGTIGYADESQAGSLGKALIKVGDAYTGPTPEAAANVLAESKRVEGRGNSSFAFDLARDTTRPGPTRSCWSPTRSPARSTPTRPRRTWSRASSPTPPARTVSRPPRRRRALRR
jgi:phosphate transport system substrate-binding protein